LRIRIQGSENGCGSGSGYGSGSKARISKGEKVVKKFHALFSSIFTNMKKKLKMFSKNFFILSEKAK